jgi:hypothetical protein
MSSQLQDGSTCEQQQQQDHSVTHIAEGRLAEHAGEVISASLPLEASAQHAGAAGAAVAADGRDADQQAQQQQSKKKRSKSSKPPLAGLKLLQPRSGSRMLVDCRAGGAAGQAADMSDVFKALQYQAHSHEQQQQQQQPEQASGDCAASAGPVAAAALPHASFSEQAAGGPGPAAAGGYQPAVCGSSSIGPCRTDLSGELAVIKQELSSNGSVDHASCNSSMMHLPMPGPSSSSSYDAGSSLSRGVQQHDQHQQEDSAAVQQQRKRQRPTFQYGNYHHYYGYRIGPSGFEDARLKVGLLSVA